MNKNEKMLKDVLVISTSIIKLKTENKMLREENDRLRTRIVELEHIFDNKVK